MNTTQLSRPNVQALTPYQSARKLGATVRFGSMQTNHRFHRIFNFPVKT